MREINSAQIGTTAGAICRLPRPVTFPFGRLCSRLRAEITVVVKQTNAAAQNLTGASVKAIVACMFDTSTLRFGDRKPEIVDSSLPYARAREQFIALSMDDFVVSLSTYQSGAAQRIRDIADADVWAATMAQNATVTLTIEVARAFEVARLGHDAYAYCPGSTQMKQVQFEFTRGATFEATGNFVQNAAADVLFIADDVEAADDVWSFVPRLFQQEEAGRESHGPTAPIGLIAMWEYTGAGSGTALTIFSIRRTGDSPLHEAVRAARVVRDASYTDPIGAYDLNRLATVLHNIPGDAEKHDIPVGSGFVFQQTAAELAPPKTAWLHVPVYSLEQVDAIVGQNVQSAAGVKAIRASAKGAKNLTSALASIEPVILAPKEASDFEHLPGRLYVEGAEPQTHVPQPILSAMQASVHAASGSEAKASAADKAAKALGKAVPGSLSGMRGRASSWLAGMRARFLGGK
jgi:hypothetical protein